MKRFEKKNCMKTMWAFLVLFLIAMWHAPNARCASEPAEGTVTFQFTTVTTAQQFAPRHVMAVWVADRRGSLVTTLRVNGGRYSRYLAQWSLTAGRSRVDAVSGATLRFHDTHTVVWDCRDAGGNVVPDGEYQIRVEFTEKNGAGPAIPNGYIRFNKGGNPVVRRPKDLAYFQKLSVEYRPLEKASMAGQPAHGRPRAGGTVQYPGMRGRERSPQKPSLGIFSRSFVSMNRSVKTFLRTQFEKLGEVL